MSNRILSQTNERQNLALPNAKPPLAMNTEDSSLGSPRLVIITEAHR